MAKKEIHRVIATIEPSDFIKRPEVRKDAEDWAKALRSGKYHQGVGNLYNPDTDTYCCMGVWQELNEKPVYQEYASKNKSANNRGREPISAATPSSTGDPAPFGDKATCANAIGAVRNGVNREEGPISLNDGFKLTFDQIADLLMLKSVEVVLENR